MHRDKEKKQQKRKRKAKSPSAEHAEGVDESKLDRTNAKLDKHIKRQRQDSNQEGGEPKSGRYREVKRLFTTSNLQVP